MVLERARGPVTRSVQRGPGKGGKDPREDLRPGLCYSDCLNGGTVFVHLGRPNKTALCGRPLALLFTGWSSDATYCPECEAAGGGPVLKPAQGTLF